MGICRILEHPAFTPEDAQLIKKAYEAALLQLNLAADRDDPLTDVVAREVLEIAQTGEKDPSKICDLAIARLRA